MTTAAQDILGVAQKICEFSCEAGYRSAISRAYYSVYHGGLEWEKSFPSPGSNIGPEGGVHQQLINRLRNPAPEIKDPDLRALSRRIAARLDALRTKRKAADYLLAAAGHEAIDAANCCAQAKDVLEKIGGGNADSSGSAPSPADCSTDSDIGAAPEPEPPPPAPPASGRPSLRRIR